MVTAALGALAATTADQVRRGQPLRLTGAERIGTTAALALVGLTVVVIGRYGWRRGAELIPRTTAEAQIPHRAAVLRRGAIACMVAGAVVLAAAGVVAAG